MEHIKYRSIFCIFQSRHEFLPFDHAQAYPFVLPMQDFLPIVSPRWINLSKRNWFNGNYHCMSRNMNPIIKYFVNEHTYLSTCSKLLHPHKIYIQFFYLFDKFGLLDNVLWVQGIIILSQHTLSLIASTSSCSACVFHYLCHCKWGFKHGFYKGCQFSLDTLFSKVE